MTNKTKFTDGPWTHIGGKLIAHIPDEKYPGSHDSVCYLACEYVSEEAEANAKLIACAPEMYELLNTYLYETDVRVLSEFEERVKKLITKATLEDNQNEGGQ